MFIHHPDGRMRVGEFSCPLGEFLTYEPAYQLPEGYTGRIYEPGVRHMLMTAISETPQPLVWPEGDGYLAKEAAYAVAHEAAQPKPSADDLAFAIQWQAAQDDLRERWKTSPLYGKTPVEIYTLMQNAVDGWTTLAQAKTALRVWLPLIAAVIAWDVEGSHQR